MRGKIQVDAVPAIETESAALEVQQGRWRFEGSTHGGSPAGRSIQPGYCNGPRREIKNVLNLAAELRQAGDSAAHGAGDGLMVQIDRDISLHAGVVAKGGVKQTVDPVPVESSVEADLRGRRSDRAGRLRVPPINTGA